MRKRELYNYIGTNFSLGGTTMRLIDDVLNYVESQVFTDSSKKIDTIHALIGTIGISPIEIGAFLIPETTWEDVEASFALNYDGPDIWAIHEGSEFLIHHNGYSLEECKDIYASQGLFTFDCSEEELQEWRIKSNLNSPRR